ncbi:MAG TPA: DUF333 domain-containing protein, partial [Anaerolineae bacterium]|nr:DUF333 domain-containing protein [Anaerolineae bacterium]
MKVVRSVSFVVVMCLLFAGLAGCGPGVAGVTTSTPESQGATPTPESQDATPTPEIQGATPVSETYSDPFAYCATVGTADAPGPEYTGPDMPGAVVQGLRGALNVPETPLDVLENGSFWRCMDGEVYACFVGANLPCEAKADTDRTPTQEETDFCQANPNSDLVPAVVTGRETVYEWRCREGTPEIVRQLFEPDAQGYLPDIWYRISPEGEGAALPNPAAQHCAEVGGSWSLETRSDGGQYGICLFEDNRQCEEWALLNGHCPVGGLKVTGYLTAAAVYCAITGGEYTITGNSGAEDEQGTCTLPDGTECDVWAYYEG